MAPHRRLAAIMFSDIAGYTAIMESDEQRGLAIVQHFKEVIIAQVPTYHGEVLQFMGDGSLCVFQSAVNALQAAVAIQQELQHEPQVPLRIGIHTGDIIIEKENIYGDGVNMASRVESMSVPGAVLITEQVIPYLKSHPELTFTIVGRFQFKNAKQPTKVFALTHEALVVPKAHEIKGKGKKISSNSRFLYVTLGFFVSILAIFFSWKYFQKSTYSTSPY